MQNYVEAARWLGAAAAADYTDAQVEYAIALFNGTGVEKSEAGAVTLLSRAARKGSPIAQNRLAHIYAAGRVLAADAGRRDQMAPHLEGRGRQGPGPR